MNVVIEGSRSSREDWLRAQKLSAEELPLLSPQQKKVAAELRISEATFARSVKAGELSSGELVDKARIFGEWVERETRLISPDAKVLEAKLATFEGMFQILLHVSGRTIVLRIEEDLWTNCCRQVPITLRPSCGGSWICMCLSPWRLETSEAVGGALSSPRGTGFANTGTSIVSGG